MADEASFVYTPAEVFARDEARRQSATTVTDVVDRLVAVAGTGSLAVVIFAPPRVRQDDGGDESSRTLPGEVPTA